MSRELRIDIVANDVNARERLGTVEAAVAAAKVEVKAASVALDDLIDLANKSGPKGMVKFVDELKRAGTALSDAKARTALMNDELKRLQGGPRGEEGAGAAAGAMSTLTDSLKGYLTTAAILGAIKNTADFANNLQRMSSQTGLGTSALQELNYAAKLSNVSMDGVVSSISQMERRLAEGGDKGAIQAVRKLGFSIDAVRATGPSAFFEIAAAIDQLPPSFDKAKIETEIFGRAGVTALAPVIEHLEQVRKEAHDVGAVMDEETVAALGRLNNMVDRLTLGFKVWIGSGLTPVIERLEQMGTVALGLEGKFPAWLKSLLGVGGATGGIAQTALNMSGAQGALDTGTSLLDWLDLAVNGQGGLPGTGAKTKDDAAARLATSQALSAARISARGMGTGGPNPDNEIGLLQIDHIAKELASQMALNNTATRQMVQLLKAGADEAMKLFKISVDTDALDLQMNQHLTERLNLTKGLTEQILRQADIAKENTAAALGPVSDPIQAAAEARDQKMRTVDDMQKAYPGLNVTAEIERINREYNKAVDVIVGGASKIAGAHEAAASWAGQLSAAHAGAVAAAGGLSNAFAQFSGVMVAGTGQMAASLMPATTAGDWSARDQALKNSQRNRGEFFMLGMGGGMPHFAEGGPITKDGPIFAHQGEFVLTKDQAANGVGGGINFEKGAIVIQNVSSESHARILADQVAEKVMRRMKQNQRITYSKS